MKKVALHSWTADLLMEALQDKFATQSNSVRRAFREVAQPGQDKISKTQIRRLLHNLNLTGVAPSVLTELFSMIDVDGNGSVDYREFKEAFGEGICGARYEAMDVFHGGEMHRANVAGRSLRSCLRDMELEAAIRELRTRMSTQHMKVRTAFRALDRNSSGSLDRNELILLLQNYHIKLSEHDLNRLFLRIDTNNSGKISYREFNDCFGADISGSRLSAVASPVISKGTNIRLTKHIETQKERCLAHHKDWTTTDFMNAMESILMTRSRTVRRIFRVADSDKSGCIDAQEWRNALRQLNLEMPPDKAKEFFDVLDKNGDGHINYREFVTAFGDIIAGFRDTGIIKARHQVQAKLFGDSIRQPRHVPKVPRYTVDQMKEAIAKRLGGKYTSARAAFRNIDLDKGGTLDKNEFRRFIRSLNVELIEEDYELLYRELDRDGNGSIDYKEFLFWFGEAICGAPWQTKESTGLCTAGVPHLANKLPKPILLSSEAALRLLHLKLTETSTSVNKVFKRYNKGRSTTLSRKQFKQIFDNYHLSLSDSTVAEIIKHIQCSHGIPADGSGLDFPLFVKEFGRSIAGEAFIGVVNQNPGPTDCRATKPTPKCTAKQTRLMLIDKLVTNFKHSRTAFARFNLARNNAMTRAELRSALVHYHIHLSDEEFFKFAEEFDKDNTGIIDFRKFIATVGAEVSGTTDNGLSAAMQANDDLQRVKLKDLHKELERQSFLSESESENDIDEEFNASAQNFKVQDCATPRLRLRGPVKGLVQIGTKSRQRAGTDWDMRSKLHEPKRSALHNKHWKAPPARPVRRAVSAACLNP